VNVLERWVEEELTRVPAGPSADELRHRGRVRRARRVGALGVVAIVLGILGIALLQSPDSQRVQVTEPVPTEPATTAAPTSTLPLATTAEFPPLDKIIKSVSGNVKSNTDPKAVLTRPISAEIVATTDTQAYPIFDGSRTGKPIYVVQVIGSFICQTCEGPANYEIRGDALQVFFDTDGTAFRFAMGSGYPYPHTLDPLGKVYRLALP
jgi:hypothetical protein